MSAVQSGEAAIAHVVTYMYDKIDQCLLLVSHTEVVCVSEGLLREAPLHHVRPPLLVWEALGPPSLLPSLPPALPSCPQYRQFWWCVCEAEFMWCSGSHVAVLVVTLGHVCVYPSPHPTAPTPVLNFTVTEVDPFTLDLSWNAPEDPGGRPHPLTTPTPMRPVH